MSIPQEMVLPPKKRLRCTHDEPEHRLVKRRVFMANIMAKIRFVRLKQAKKNYFDKIALHQKQWKTYRERNQMVPKFFQNIMKQNLKIWRKYHRRLEQEKEKNECVYLLCCLRKKPIYNDQDAIYNILKMICKAPIIY